MCCQVRLMLCSVHFTPTVQHCSMATLIGLSLRVKLMQTLPSRFKVGVCLPRPRLFFSPNASALMTVQHFSCWCY